MPDQICKQEKSDRVARLAKVEAELRASYFQSLIGEPLQMMVESNDEGQYLGTACRYAPMSLNNGDYAKGQLVSAKANAIENGVLVCD